MPLSRRAFLKSTAAVAGLSTLPTPAEASQPVVSVGGRARGKSGGKARGVIFMVSDGMSTGTLTLADMLKRKRDRVASQWVSLWQVPGVKRASMWTMAADSLVTDSAAGGAAWSIGRKCNNGALCITPDGVQHEPILVTARRHGLATGVVTTTRLTHATPASFIVNMPSRDMEREIAQQMLEHPIDVMLGGGERYFSEELLAKHPDVHVARSAGALGLAPESVGAGEGRLLGLFGRDHVPFVLDRGPSVPSLAQMTDAALSRFMRSDRGFVLQVEGGRVDHAAHDNDIGAVLTEQLDFDDAIGVALRYVAQDPSILLIITTDHANGNPGLTHYGQRGNDGFDRLLGVRCSFEWISAELGKVAVEERESKIGELVESATGIALLDREFEQLTRVMRRERVHPFDVLNSRTGVLGSLLANHFGVGFLSPNHTADLVELTAMGPGVENLPQVVDNTDLYQVMLNAMGMTPA